MRHGPSGSQTLLRGLDVLEAVAAGSARLTELAARLELTRSTTHRLANALIERGYLVLLPQRGYQLGPKLLELGYQAQQQIDLVQLARPHLEALAQRTKDTVHLGVLDGDRALCLSQVPGSRRIIISGRVGDRHPLTSTGLGKALLINERPERWRELYDQERQGENGPEFDQWLDRMRNYARAGHAYDLEEDEDHIRSVAVPVRDASGKIVAAVSVSSPALYMTDERMHDLTDEVLGAAKAISSDLGFSADDSWNSTERR
jgi:DNA-binding IclR family transcriptional regulator